MKPGPNLEVRDQPLHVCSIENHKSEVCRRSKAVPTRSSTPPPLPKSRLTWPLPAPQVPTDLTPRAWSGWFATPIQPVLQVTLPSSRPPSSPRAPDRRLSRLSWLLSRSRRLLPRFRRPLPRTTPSRNSVGRCPDIVGRYPGPRPVALRSRRPLPIPTVSTCDSDYPYSRIPGRCYSLLSLLLLSPVVFVDWEP